MGQGKAWRFGIALVALGALVAAPLAGRAAIGALAPDDDIPGVALPASQPVSGQVSAGAAASDDVYAVRIPAGRWFWARLSAPAGPDLDLYLFGPSTKSIRSTRPALVFSERQGTSLEFVRYRASVDTTAYVDVAAYEGEGTYWLRYGMPETEISVSSKAPSRCDWQGSTLVSGTLTRSSDGAPVGAGEWVYLHHRPYGAKRYTIYAKTQTDEDGSYSFEVKPTKRTVYQVRHLGSADFVAPVDPDGETITPYAYLTTPVVPSTLKAKVDYRVYGYLKPHHPAGAQSVEVRCYQLQPDGTYELKVKIPATNFDHATRAGTITKYRATLRVPEAGAWKFRAYIPGDSQHASTFSIGWRQRIVK